MNWIDFQWIADEQGLESSSEIDSIEMIGKRFDICFTDKDGYSGVISIEEETE